MAEQELKTKLIARNDTAANWVASDPVLLRGELGVETDTGKVKYGDGVKAWSALPYSVPMAADVSLSPIDGMAATTVQEAVAENFQSVVDGKMLLEAAVSDKGGTVEKAGSVATFAELKAGVSSIAGGSGECTITFDNYNPSGGAQKETYEPLSRVRYGSAAATVGDKALFMAGYVKSSNTHVVSAITEAYTIDGVRQEFPSLPAARANTEAVAVGSKAIIAGGYTGSSVISTASAYTQDGILSAYPALSQSRYWIAAASIGTYALFIGGSTAISGSSTSKNVDAYTEEGVRTAFPALGYGRRFHSASTITDKCIVGGGEVDGSYRTTVEVYTGDGTKVSFPNLSVGRINLSATTIGQKALFAGGMGGGSVKIDAVDVYTNDGVVSLFHTLSQARRLIAATTALGNAFFAGGGETTAAFDIVESYTEDGIYELLPALSQKGALIAATSLDSKAVFAGGMNNTTLNDIVEVYASLDYVTIPVFGGGVYDFGDGEHMIDGSMLDADATEIVVKKPVNGYVKYKGAIFGG